MANTARENDHARMNPNPFPHDTPRRCAERLAARYGMGIAQAISGGKWAAYQRMNEAEQLREGGECLAWAGYMKFWAGVNQVLDAAQDLAELLEGAA